MIRTWRRTIIAIAVLTAAVPSTSAGPELTPSQITAPAGDLQGKLYRSVFSTGVGALKYEDLPNAPEELRTRLHHFVRETARAPLAARAFRDANRDALGQLSADSQRDAHELLGNQIPETITLAQLARDIGAFASSSFGAGFGGSVWAAVRTTDAERFGAEWVRAYQARMPHVGTVDWFIARPGPAATEIPL